MVKFYKTKFLFLFFLFFVSANINAKSDIQLSWPMISLFESSYTEWENYTYKKGHIFDYSGNLFEITNHNFIWLEKLGFYESVSIIADKSSWGKNFLSLQFSGGSSFYVCNCQKFEILADAWLHILLHSLKYIELGIEGDFQLKFTPKRRCSPILGINANFNFYANGPAQGLVGEYIRSLSSYLSYEIYKPDSKIEKYFKFNIQPYIALGINL